MAAIIPVAQVVWIYYGLRIGSRPVIAGNVLAVLINSATVISYRYFVRQERVRVLPSESAR
jgi:hypothetical protein